jgi:DNA-binding LacI/PurR family transcriptional regulator
MTAAVDLGYQIPEDVRIVGIDDLEYAKLLPVPLTTVHNTTTRDILLDCELVVRRSCGSSFPSIMARH